MFVLSFTLRKGTLTAPLLLFYQQLGLIRTKKPILLSRIRRSVSSVFSFVQSAVDAKRQGYENPNCSVVAEATKLFRNRSTGYQNMDRTLHTVTKYLSDEKTYVAVISKTRSCEELIV